MIIVGCVFLFTAAAKAANPLAFRAALLYFSALPDVWLMALGAGVIMIETTLGAALLASFRPRLTTALTLALMLGLTGVVLVMVLDPHAPACGCTGESLIAAKPSVSNKIALGRNIALTGLAAFALIGALHGAPTAPDSRAQTVE